MAPLPPPIVAEPINIKSTIAHHKAFMSTKPPNFTGKEKPDKAEV